jgi:hypothetical protein
MVVPCVAGGVQRLQRAPSELYLVAVGESYDALLGDRLDCAPELLHRLAEDTGGAHPQLRRIDEMRRADLVHRDSEHLARVIALEAAKPITTAP